MTKYEHIDNLEHALNNARRDYLVRHGWRETSNTPGSFWLWRRDFADVDKKRETHYRPPGSAFHPYGIITADTDMAVKMTANELDQDVSEMVEG